LVQGVIAVAALTLLAAPAASAVSPTPVRCDELATLLGSGAGKATPGEVLQLQESGPCALSLEVTNTAAFTLEGASGGGTVLEPLTPTEPILQSKHNVMFTLSGLTFTGTKGAEAAVLLEGEEEAVTLTGNTFTDNRENDRAGGVYISHSKETSALTTIAGNVFTDDSATEDAGGLFLENDGRAVIDANTFSGDSASEWGGGMYVVQGEPTSDPVQISGNTFGGPTVAAGNTTNQDGAGAAVAAGPGQPVTLTENTFENNRIAGKEAFTYDEDGREGGGLFMDGYSTGSSVPAPVTQEHNLFSDNVIEATPKSGSTNLLAGGAGEWINGLTVHSTGDTFTGNRIAVDSGEPPEGGALGAIASAAVGHTPAKPATFIGADDLFLGNSTVAGGWGGAIYVGNPPPVCTMSCPGSSVTLEDSTVVSNTVEAGAGSEGGAIWGSPQDTLTIDNSILFGNSPQPEVFGFGSTTPLFAYSDVCAEAGGPAVPSTAGDICSNPQLEAGGQETPASPTIDKGSNTLVPAGLGTDLGGAPRIVASTLTCNGLGPATVDMGAFEYQHVTSAPSCPAPVKPAASEPPVLAGASQSHRIWREGTRLASISRKHRPPPLGTTFTFTVSEQATVSFVFTQQVGGRRVGGRCVAQTRRNRHRHACTRTVTRGALSFAAAVGTDKVAFQGRLSHAQRLRPGTYTVVITAKNAAGQRSASRRLTFTIVR
jgi:Right handed beta helix region